MGCVAESGVRLPAGREELRDRRAAEFQLDSGRLQLLDEIGPGQHERGEPVLAGELDRCAGQKS